MKKLAIFTIVSVLLHALILILPLPERDKPVQKPTVVEVISTKPAEKPTLPVPPAETPVQETPEEPQPPHSVIPNTPPPEENIPVRLTPEVPSPDEPSTDRPQAPVITPRPPSLESPPEPYSLGEFLSEQLRQEERMGPDRSERDIIRDYLNNTPLLPPGEDLVSFRNMRDKYDSYFYRFSRSLYAEWRYPPAAAARGESGVVRGSFTILPDGKITNLNMIQSSGYPELDREVMRTLRSMAPVSLPPAYELEQLHVNGFFIYSLTGEYRLY